ncbi:hypothetical protein MLPF_2913 [Mycobacterium lepromatosis]|nr:hypothetical protein MLPF_2913 [Mycobacterium lepromatosis]
MNATDDEVVYTADPHRGREPSETYSRAPSAAATVVEQARWQFTGRGTPTTDRDSGLRQDLGPNQPESCTEAHFS